MPFLVLDPGSIGVSACPGRQAPLAQDRLMALCLQGGVGWLAHSATGWFDRSRGTAAPTRALHALRRAVHASTPAAVFD